MKRPSGHVWDAREGFIEDPEARGLVVVPAPIDAHTHVGDRVGRGRLPPGISLAQAVRPPDGLKHRLLASTPRDVLVYGMRQAMLELLAEGTSAFADFREQGADGVRMLREAAVGLPIQASVFGRCAGPFHEEEAEPVLRVADGYGWSGLADAEGAERAASLARKLGKRFALHFSEEAREDVGRALDLRPAFLVHATRATREDLDAIAAARVPVVLCPRSNERFGAFPDVDALVASGVPLALGSDNAMLHALGVLHDARRLVARGMPRDVALRAALEGGRLVVPDAPREWIALGPRGDDPDESVFAESPPDVAWLPRTKG